MNEKQKQLLFKLGLDETSDLDIIEDKVADYLAQNGFDENYQLVEDGLICESILDYIGDIDEK